MKSTLVLSLDEDTTAFIEQVRNRAGSLDPNTYINQLIRQEQQRQGFSAKGAKPSAEARELQHFTDEQIPSAG